MTFKQRLLVIITLGYLFLTWHLISPQVVAQGDGSPGLFSASQFTPISTSSTVISTSAPMSSPAMIEPAAIMTNTSRWTTYTEADGLVDNWVTAIAIDPAGHKWFGTNNGVSEFDGRTWITYTTADGLVDNQVNAIAIDAAGHKWFGTSNGVSEFSGQPQIAGSTIATTATVTASPELGLTPPAATPTPATAVATTPSLSSTSFPNITLPSSLPQVADLPPGIFDANEANPALLYLQDEVLFRVDLRQQLTQPVAYVPSSGREVILSPDGHYLAYADEIGLQILDTKSGETYPLFQHIQPTADEPTRVEFFSPPAWSPQNILVVRHNFWEGATSSWVNLAEKIPHPLGAAPIDVAWSPSGTQIAIIDSQYGGDFDSFTIMDLEDQTNWYKLKAGLTFVKGNYEVIANPYHLDWSPSGEWVVVSLAENVTEPFIVHLYLMRPNGRDLTRLTDNAAGQADFPLWAPAGTLYYGLSQVGPQVDGLYQYDPASQTHTRLIGGADLQPLSLSPDGEFLLYQQGGGFNKAGALYAWSVQDQQIVPLATWPAEGPMASLVGWLGGEPFQQQWQVETLLVAPGEPGRLYALTKPKKLNEALVRQLLISDDFGQTWLPFSGGLPVESDCLHNLNLDYATSDALYASTCQGLYRWSGSEWVLVSEQKTCMVAVVYGQPELIWAIESKGGCPFGATILRSQNGGQTWLPANTGLQGRGISNIAIDPGNANVLYSIASAKWSSNLHRGTAIGQWSPLPNPEGQLFLQNSMTMDGAGTIYVLGNSDLSLWRSQNPDSLDREKVQWERVHDFGQSIYPELLASGWGPNGLALYANLAEIRSDGFIVNPTLHRSLDGGQTWEPIPTFTYTPTPLPPPTALPTASSTPEPQAIRPAQEESKLAGSQPGLALTRTVRIGLHGRNDIDFHELDYQLIQTARIETLKMMSTTKPEVFARLKRDNPELELIVRLYDDRINADGHPTPVEFADKMIPLMQELQPYVTKFEIGNEPNHFQRYEGWGPDDADAANFKQWFLAVYDLLKTAHPWAELGFPALGTPDSVHRDRVWLEINREAIERADWLGVHCYWQTRPDGTSTMFDEARGLCFKYYHEKFPNKPLELTEFDNDNVIWNIPPLSPEEIAAEYVTYYQELFKYPYLRSASSFIMSSPDRRWEYFVWRTEGGAFKPVVAGIAEMPRPPLIR